MGLALCGPSIRKKGLKWVEETTMDSDFGHHDDGGVPASKLRYEKA